MRPTNGDNASLEKNIFPLRFLIKSPKHVSGFPTIFYGLNDYVVLEYYGKNVRYSVILKGGGVGCITLPISP